jgi:hypothetical protein
VSITLHLLARLSTRGAERYAGTMDLFSVFVDDVAPCEVGPGCLRRDLPGAPGVSAWLVDIAPGAEWPYADVHPTPEQFLVVSGELIEDDTVYRAGSYLAYAAGTQHRPRTITGVRLFGFHLAISGCAP